MAWVIDNAEVGGGELLVLLMVANHARSDGREARPSVASLAAECRMSVRQVQRILASLVAAGHLELEGATKVGVRVYRIAGMGGDKMSPGGVTPASPGGDIATLAGGDIAVSPDPSLTIREPSVAREGAPSLAAASAIAGGFVADLAEARARRDGRRARA